MQLLKKILKVIISIGLFFYIILVIYGFIHSWKAGLTWLVGAFFTIGLLGTFLDKTKPTTKGTKIFMAVISFIAFVVGVQFLPKELRERKPKPKTEIAKKEIEENYTPTLDSAKLKAFQKQWADSVVKDWKGKFILSSSIVFPDTIKFEMSKDATKPLLSNRRDMLPMYQKDYEKSFIQNFGNRNNTTFVTFEPNSELLKNSNNEEWMHPVMNNNGLKIFSGNEYYKEFVGTLTCKYKNKSTKETYFVLTTDKGKSIEIAEYKYKSYYWVRKNDPNNINVTGLNECY